MDNYVTASPNQSVQAMTVSAKELAKTLAEAVSRGRSLNKNLSFDNLRIFIKPDKTYFICMTMKYGCFHTIFFFGGGWNHATLASGSFGLLSHEELVRFLAV